MSERSFAWAMGFYCCLVADAGSRNDYASVSIF